MSHTPISQDLQQFSELLFQAFEEQANPVRARQMEQYMRNQFTFLGIPQPRRKEISRPFLRALTEQSLIPPADLIHLLWPRKEREYQYFCLDYLVKAKKQWTPEIIKEFEWMITTRSWWDTVDLIATQLVGPYFRQWPERMPELIGRWSESENFWLVRTAILFQLHYKQDTDLPLLLDIIRKHCHSNEFFIQKAIGWALRSYAKVDPAAVLRFLDQTEVKPLSRREALRRVDLAGFAADE